MTSSITASRSRWKSQVRADAPIVRARRISRRLLFAFCRRAASRKHSTFVIAFNPVYADASAHCDACVSKPLTTSRSTDSGCALDFDDVASLCGSCSYSNSLH